MSGFYNDMIIKMGLPITDTVGVRVTVCDFFGVLIEGHNGILGYASDAVSLRIKRKKLVICGKNLKINQVTHDELYIQGKITSFALEDGKHD